MLFVRPQLPSAAIIVAIGVAAATIRFLHLRLSHSPSLKSISTKICPSAGGSTMDSSGPSLLVLCSKSPEDNEFAQSLRSKWKTLNLLGEEGNGEIKVLLFSEMDSADQSTFQSQFYMKALSSSTFGKFLIWSPRLPSTHDLVSRNFCDIPVGSVCVADVQFKGRVQMEDGRKLPLLQYVASLVVTEAVKEACQAKGLPKLDVRIKWLNDLYLNGLKVGGILCTSTYR